jgi:hypothetical protein
MKTQIKKESTNEHSIYRRDMIFYLKLILRASEKAKNKNKYWNVIVNRCFQRLCEDMLDILYKRLLTYKDYNNLDHYADNLQENFGLLTEYNKKLITIYDSEIQDYISSVQNLKDLFIQSKFIK